jgi:Zn-dependent protease with chaperone function
MAARRDADPTIGSADQPALLALVARVAGRLRTRAPDRVLVTPGVNAFAAQTGGFMGLGSTRAVGVGLGLVALDTVSQLEATIAHELAHLSGGDRRGAARLRRWLERLLGARGFTLLLAPVGPLSRVAQRFARAAARRRQLEADRAGVAVAGRAAHVTGLEREHQGARLFARFLEDEVDPLLARGFRPRNAFDGFRAYVEEVEGSGAPVEQAGPAAPACDAHPTLAERIGFARTLPDPPAAQDDRPARSLLANPERLEREVSERLAARRAPGRRLEPVEWTEVPARVWAPALAAEGRRFAACVASELGVAPTPSASVRALVRALEASGAEGAALVLEPALAGSPPAERARHAERLVARALGTLLGCALVQAGGAWRSDLGRPLEIAVGRELVPPYRLAEEAVADRRRLPELARRAGDAEVG